MSFNKDGAHLNEVPKTQPIEVNFHQLQGLVDTHDIDTRIRFHLITTCNSSTSTPNPSRHIPQLLTKYFKLFQTPNSLPPKRPIYHKITLTDTSNLVNFLPYR